MMTIKLAKFVLIWLGFDYLTIKFIKSFLISLEHNESHNVKSRNQSVIDSVISLDVQYA